MNCDVTYELVITIIADVSKFEYKISDVSCTFIAIIKLFLESFQLLILYLLFFEHG